MSPEEFLKDYLDESSQCVLNMVSDPTLLSLLFEIANECLNRLQTGNKLLFV